MWSRFFALVGIILLLSSAHAVSYLHANGLTAKMDRELNFYHADSLGSTRTVTDEAAEVVERQMNLPFGEILEGDEKYGFTGKELDESGLQYFGARYYDSGTGRFTSVDPARDGENWYAYAGSNPLAYKDENGMWRIWLPGSVEEGFEFYLSRENGDHLDDLHNEFPWEWEKQIELSIEKSAGSYINIHPAFAEFMPRMVRLLEGFKEDEWDRFRTALYAVGAIDDEEDISSYNAFRHSALREIRMPNGNVLRSIKPHEVRFGDLVLYTIKGGPGHLAVFLIRDREGETYLFQRSCRGNPCEITQGKDVKSPSSIKPSNFWDYLLDLLLTADYDENPVFYRLQIREPSQQKHQEEP